RRSMATGTPLSASSRTSARRSRALETEYRFILYIVHDQFGSGVSEGRSPGLLEARTSSRQKLARLSLPIYNVARHRGMQGTPYIGFGGGQEMMTRTRWRWAAAAVPVAVVLAWAAPRTIGQGAPNVMSAGTAKGEWPTYGGNLASMRYSPLDQINAD